jgi:predicted MFS family arabinose efflux permease
LLGPLRQHGFLTVLVAILAVGLGLGAVDIGVAARAQHEATASAAGYLLAALSLGSVVGGLAWGHRTHRRRPSTHIAALLSVLAVGVVVAAWAPNLVVLGIALAFTGLALAPAFVVAYVATDNLVPETGRTEATTWVNTANNIGSAAGAAAAGAVVDQMGASTSFLAAALVLVSAVLVVLVSHRSIDRRSPL